MMSTKLTDESRAAFAALADFLIPAHKKMPAASQTGVAGPLLDEVLRLRPDLQDDFMRGIGAITGEKACDAANALYKEDEAAFNALSLVASAAYYMTPEAREALGYPGQESLTYDAHTVPEYMTDGMIERVTRRGSIYKPTPR
ncbi:MAG: hypothetical protein P8Q36_00590 [Alphaproteobacteria bacterium]|jgi:hypothetical protein|nr:hypothetical protein [Rhodospirillaceae bacterium]MDG2479353.1 hypothetical protein [Alphaproteobacteria bacterium]